MAPELLGALKLVLAVQASQALVAGTVRDAESGAPLRDAVVSLTDLDRSAVSDTAGRYQLADVPAGPQHLTVKRIGYSPRTIHALVPGEGRLDIDLSLRPLPLQLPTIVVRSTVAMRGLEEGDSTPFPDRGISAAGIRNHPMLAEPDGFLALGGGEVAISPEIPSGIHVRGGASDQTAYLLDGVPVFNPYHAAGTFSAWNPDALERLKVTSASPSLAPPDALSGAVVADTRAPGSEFRVQGTRSTSHGRLTVHGPFGGSGAGFLLSLRSGFPDMVAPGHDPSFVRGRTGDLLAKVEVPALGGRIRFLGYDSRNQLDAVALAERPGSSVPRTLRHGFDWQSTSVGLEWKRRIGAGTEIRIQSWNARGEAEAGWHPSDSSGLALESDREDQGLLAAVEHRADGRFTGAGIRVQRSRTLYRVTAQSDTGGGTSLGARTPLAAVFVQHRRPLWSTLTADVALSATGAAGGVFLGTQAELRWRPWQVATLSGSYVRSHQFSQSLRNSESVAGGIFPADLFLGASARGVPVARSDRAVLAGELLAVAGLRVGAQAYLSNFDGLLLVAPRTGTPFATGGFTTGAGTSSGFSLDAAVSSARYGVTASYGWQRVRVTYGDSSYAPGYGTSHSIETGVIVFPTPTASVRLGLTGEVGRRGTGILGPFEWESCNLLDKGCEFGGTPTHDTGGLGSTRLPSYFRLDLGLRKHWHLEIGGRDVELALFGSVTNLLGRRNVLAVATDPVTGRKTEIGMRPLAPLVVGLDWRF
jgi:carboxypeptidase family protein/TonB-dependent receptor-like protein